MDKIKFITIETEKFSMALNYSDIIAIYNKGKNIEIMLCSTFIVGKDKNKVLTVEYEYDKIVKDFENNDDFEVIDNIIVNKYYNDSILSPLMFPSKTDKEFYQYEDITSLYIESAPLIKVKNFKQTSNKINQINKINKINIKTASSEEIYKYICYNEKDGLDCIINQLEAREDFIKVEQEDKIMFININSIISCVKVETNIYIVTFGGIENKIVLKYTNETEANSVHSIIIGSLDFKTDEKENNNDNDNKVVSYEYETINKFLKLDKEENK